MHVSRNFTVALPWFYRRMLAKARMRLWILRETHPNVARFLFFLVRGAPPSDKLRTDVERSTPPLGKAPSVDFADPSDNLALALAEYAAGSLRLKSTPPTMTVESSSWCNLRCVMCPHAINDVHRPKHIETELVERLEKFIRQSKSIKLHGIGEPLASRAFWYNLSLLPTEGHSEVNTNFTLLDEQKLKGLVDSRLKLVNVSLDAARSETYRKIRGYSFEKVIDNVRRFLAERNAHGKKFPLLYMNMTLMRSNIEEVTEFIELAASLGADAVFFGHLNRWTEREMRRYIIDRDGWVFDYAKEGLWNFPALSDEHLRKAEQLARERGIPLHFDANKQVFFDEEQLPHV